MKSPERNLPTIVCAAVILLANLGALAYAWNDQGWGAFGIAVLAAPIGNAVLAVLSSFVAIPFLKAPSFPVRRHVLVSIAVPAGAAVLDYFLIFAMPLHGC